MRKIETAADLVIWAAEVNSFKRPQEICDLQDVFVRSTLNDIKAYFVDLDQNDKELAIFSIQKAMGSATLFDFIKVYARHRGELHIENEGAEINKRWSEVLQRECDFENEKAKLHATIKALGYQNSELDKDNCKVSAECSKYVQRIWALESEIEELRTELDKQYKFESHIKELLAA